MATERAAAAGEAPWSSGDPAWRRGAL